MAKLTRLKIKGIKDKIVSAKINQIVGHMECPKEFSCINKKIASPRMARDCGMEDYLECLENNPLPCKYFIIFGTQHFCQCPLMVYIVKHTEQSQEHHK